MQKGYILGNIILALCLTFILTQAKDPWNNFKNYEVIRPMVRARKGSHLRPLEEIQRLNASYNELSITFQAFGEDFRLELSLNEDLLPQHYLEIYQQGGSYVHEKPMLDDQSGEHCHYKGHLRGENTSWAAISICNGISGAISHDKDLYYLHPHQNGSSTSHFIFKASDERDESFTCGVKRNLSSPSEHPSPYRMTRVRRSPEWRLQNHGKVTSIVELFVVADQSMYRKYETKTRVYERIKEITNVIHGLYLQFNITIVLAGTLVWTERDMIYVEHRSNVTLGRFTKYRREHLLKYPNDNAQLITDVDLEGTVVGLAYIGTMCSPDNSAGINQDFSVIPAQVAGVVAHEMGHNFGMQHDDEKCRCPTGYCVMQASVLFKTSVHWSSCSLEAVQELRERGNDVCLRNIPVRVALPSCGNGIIEDDEECDCGTPTYCDNPCCNATTCTLLQNATCAAGECCDLSTCQVVSAATECRGSASECDLPEYCDGNSPFCPSDVFVQDGTECEKAYCYRGRCRSHEERCRLLWGARAVPGHCCYAFNLNGDKFGNCGYDLQQNFYRRCHPNESYCGTLHCISSVNENLFITYGNNILRERIRKPCPGKRNSKICYSSSVEIPEDSQDLTLVPTGARCGEKMVCLHQKCVPVEEMRMPLCSKGCSGNGVCNSQGSCHCAVGFGPPFCDVAGPGGSIHSGPASHFNDAFGFITFTYLIFFGIFPIILIFASLLYCYCHPQQPQKSRQRKKSRTSQMRSSLKKLRKASVRSISEAVPYASFSSDEEEETSPKRVPARPAPLPPQWTPKISRSQRVNWQQPNFAVGGASASSVVTKETELASKKGVALQPVNAGVVIQASSVAMLKKEFKGKQSKLSNCKGQQLKDQSSQQRIDYGESQRRVADLAKQFDQKQLF